VPLSGKLARILMPAEPSEQFDVEAMTPDADRKVFQIADTGYRMWDPKQPVTVSNGDGVINPAEYAVAYAGGKIIFAESRDVEEEITVSGFAFIGTPSTVAQCKSWEFSPEVEIQDTTVFEDAGWKSFSSTVKGGSVSIDRFMADTFFLEVMDKPLYLLLYLTQYDTPRIECIAELTSDSINNAVAGIVEEPAELTLTGRPNVVLE
jgi:hypothetical protein